MGKLLYEIGEKEKGIQMMKEALAIFDTIESPDADSARKKLKEWGVNE